MLDSERPYEIDGMHVLVGYGLGSGIHTVLVLVIVLDNATEAKDVFMVRPDSSLNYNFTRHGEVEGCPSMRSKISGCLTVHCRGIMISLPTTKITKPPCIASHHVIQQHIIFNVL